MSFRNNNSNNNYKNYRNNNNNNKNRFNSRQDLRQSNICDICKENTFKYKCSKCKTSPTKICSMDCYKEHNNKGEHNIEQEKEIEKEEKKNDIISTDKNEKENKINPNVLAEFKPLLENPKIQELLKYNTVKYHLHKIYQLLQLDYKSIQEDTITSQKDLDGAVARYLSCFRANGVYRNEAIEEFVLLVLNELEKVNK